MPYAIVVNHRHKSANKTLVQGCPHLLAHLSAAHTKTREFQDPVTKADKVQVEDEPLYNIFNEMERLGWSLVNGFSAGTAEQYIFHMGGGEATTMASLPRIQPPPLPPQIPVGVPMPNHVFNFRNKEVS